MLLKKLNIASSTQNLKFEDVPAPEFGEGAEIRVQRINVMGQLRLGELSAIIDEAKVKDTNKENLLRMTANLMCVMVDEDGEYLIPENNIEGTLQTLDNSGVFFRLITANNNVNTVDAEFTDETLDQAKKNS